jgi:uncharacterized protein YjbI with pentapeptide repeats
MDEQKFHGKGKRLCMSDLKLDNLEKVNLEEDNLGETDLEEANLKEADFDWAKLEKADLEGSCHLSLDQLSKVRTLHNAKLDEELLISLREKYSILFEVPPEM